MVQIRWVFDGSLGTFSIFLHKNNVNEYPQYVFLWQIEENYPLIITQAGIVKPKFSCVQMCMCKAFQYVRLSPVKCLRPDSATYFTVSIQQFIV